jgi:hypothetical protein
MLFEGLEIATLHETDGLTSQLYKWVDTAQEPLRTYATGQSLIFMFVFLL